MNSKEKLVLKQIIEAISVATDNINDRADLIAQYSSMLHAVERRISLEAYIKDLTKPVDA